MASCPDLNRLPQYARDYLIHFAGRWFICTSIRRPHPLQTKYPCNKVSRLPSRDVMTGVPQEHFGVSSGTVQTFFRDGRPEASRRP
jgi:hypothetical protein